MPSPLLCSVLSEVLYGSGRLPDSDGALSSGLIGKPELLPLFDRKGTRLNPLRYVRNDTKNRISKGPFLCKWLGLKPIKGKNLHIFSCLF